MVYVDDDSDFARDVELATLNAKIQTEAEKSVDWFTNKRLCVAGEEEQNLDNWYM